MNLPVFSFFFFFNDTATTEIYTLSLHDALPISPRRPVTSRTPGCRSASRWRRDRKSTRLNSSHLVISYAVFCLKKKNKAPVRDYPGVHDGLCGLRFIAQAFVSSLAGSVFLFFFNDTATTEIYTLSLHDALPISSRVPWTPPRSLEADWQPRRDRKSTRLNSSHLVISYAVFCLKKKKTRC